jgi:hypothetical protein
MNPQIMLKFVEVHGGISDFRMSKPSLYTNVFFLMEFQSPTVVIVSAKQTIQQTLACTENSLLVPISLGGQDRVSSYHLCVYTRRCFDPTFWFLCVCRSQVAPAYEIKRAACECNIPYQRTSRESLKVLVHVFCSASLRTRGEAQKTKDSLTSAPVKKSQNETSQSPF